MSTAVQSQPAIERISSSRNSQLHDHIEKLSSNQFSDSLRGSNAWDSCEIISPKNVKGSPLSLEHIPVPMFEWSSQADVSAADPMQVCRESLKKDAGKQLLESLTYEHANNEGFTPVMRQSSSDRGSISRKSKNPLLVYNVSLGRVSSFADGEESLSGLEESQDDNELLAEVRNTASKKGSVVKDLQLFGSANEQRAQQLSYLSYEIDNLFWRLEQKKESNLVFERKNNMIRSAVLATKLEQDLRKEIKTNKEKWDLVYHDKEIEPDFESHKWILSKNPKDDLIKRQQSENYVNGEITHGKVEESMLEEKTSDA